MKLGLGTQMRHLIELLDGDVAQSYADAGLDYRPRYTPVMRVLAEEASASVGRIAQAAGLTQPAATQTIALMKKQGLITISQGTDGRERVIQLSAAGRRMLPQLQACWAATKAAADSLDADLPYPLSHCLADAVQALQTLSFAERIREARNTPTSTSPSTNPNNMKETT
jgi:DNA-binding MarR family transcriptional regulator